MKRKLLFFLTALLLFVTGNAWGRDVPYTFGLFSDGYRGAYSDPYTVKNGETLHITFTNNNNGTDKVWNNYVIEATSAVDKHDVVYFDLRGDNYAFGVGTFVQNYNGNCTSDLNGATVDNYITYAGGVITVNQIFTKAEVTTYNRVYTYTVAGSPASVIIYVTEEAAQVTITNVETSKWSTVWSTDFSSAPAGMTYSVTNGSCDITSGYISYHQGGGSGNRAINTAFTDAKFNVDTNWTMEFDWNCSSANKNASNVIFATNSGTAFSMEWAQYAPAVVVKNDEGNSICTTLPLLDYNTQTCSSWSHITINGVKNEGVYLTIAKGGVVYVNNQLVTSTFGYPATFNGSLGRALSHMYVDNVSFKTPAVAGYVATPTYTITAPDGTRRKFTLSCVTEGAKIYYATSDLEKGAAGWNTYTGEVTTDATTIYAYAKDDDDNTSEKMNFATGAGTAITLNAPSAFISAMLLSGSRYYPTYNATNNQSGVEFSPVATISATFNGSPIVLPYNVTTTGTLAITASAEGFTSATTNVVYDFVPNYVIVKSADFTKINESNLEEKLDNTWTIAGGATRWGSWSKTGGVNKDGTPNGGDAYWPVSTSSSFPMAVYDFVNLNTNGTQLLIGWGFGRNSSSNTNFTIVDAASNAVAEYIVSNYGNAAYSVYKYNETNLPYSVANGVVKGVNYYIPAPASVSKAITAAGWATYCSPYALDFSSSIDNLDEAYIVTGGEEGVLTLVEVDGTVPANTGLLLKGEGECVIPVAASSSVDVSANKLVGVTSSTELPAENGYVLMGSPKVGFYKNAKAFTVGANTAYLPIDFDVTAGARVAFFGFDEDPTAINAIEAAEAETGALKDGKYLIDNKVVIVKNGVKYSANGQILK